MYKTYTLILILIILKGANKESPMSAVLKERYFGFYLSRPMWVINQVNLQSDNLAETFTNLMSEEVFTHEHDKYILKLCRDGLFLFKIKSIEQKLVANQSSQFAEHLEEWIKYLRYANAIALLFESVFIEETKMYYFETRELTTKDAFGVMFEGGEWKGHSIATLSVAEKFQLGRHLSLYTNNIPISMNSLFLGRQVVSQAVLDQLADHFDNLYDDDFLISLFSELIKCVSEFKLANFNTSSVIAWFIVESIINVKWSNWIESKNSSDVSGKTRINSRRKKNLEGRDYSISAKLNILELNDQLPNDLFLKLDEMRTQRNKIAHREKDFQCSMSQAQGAINSTNELIEQHFNFKINLNLSLSISGL